MQGVFANGDRSLSRQADGPTDGQKPFSLPHVSLPKGGGAVRGIDEKFQVNPATGSGAMTIPLPTSSGRNGFGPQLSLSYDSGSGNGPFGLGWSLSTPNITRKTDKGVPRYWGGEQADVFILSGAEDLVPALKKNGAGHWLLDDSGNHIIDETLREGFQVRRYRPRIEGLFSRIERWTDLETGMVHWRSITKDNITSLYGKTEESRIANPDDPAQVFSWLLCESFDDKGNAIFYQYQAEDSAGTAVTEANERNRTDQSRSANRYLKRVKYGNRTPREPNEHLINRRDWMFEVVFDYDEGHLTQLPLDDEGRQLVQVDLARKRAWSARLDPFSSYRAGFEVRTYRLCHRVLMFHHFPDELGLDDYLVRSTEFAYNPGPILTHLSSVTQSGYQRQAETDQFLCRALPPVEFEYSHVPLQDGVQPEDTPVLQVQTLDQQSLENLPIGLGGSYQFVDLDGEGISGILTEQAEGWYYKPNLGNGHFGPLQPVAEKPSLALLSGGQQQLLDLAGDGQLDLALFNSPTPGFYERTPDQHWIPFRNFISLPNVDWADPNLRFVDLTGDGHADLLLTEEDIFTWYPSQAEAGFGPHSRVYQPWDEEAGPRRLFSDGFQSLYLSDMSGDGLVDLVRIRNGEICYWPNLGYGRFGPKVAMDNAPWFDTPDGFSHSRIHLADVDGSGITDILYLSYNGVQLFYNQAGNSWSQGDRLPAFPGIDDQVDIQVVDLLGNGTACLIWSSPLPHNAGRQLQYVDLMNGTKPHLLIRTKNNLGAETAIHYASSTKFYLADQAAGNPWITRQPFPVQVVEKVETFDRISRNRFVTRYSYHHGYFDGEEREFRGFGRVDQYDTEAYALLSESDQFPTGENVEAASHIPPVLTRSWFHTGAYLQDDQISQLFLAEYYQESEATFHQQLLPDTVLPADITTIQGEREAVRALKGSMLRQEVYALDGTAQEAHPYVVTEQNFTVNLVQPLGQNQHAVFFTHPRESLSYHYERNPAHPRIQHNLTLAVDGFGNILRSAAIGYGRRQPDPNLDATDRDKQAQTWLTYSENRFTNPIDQPDAYRIPAPSESLTYELSGIPAPAANNRYTFTEIDDAVQNAAPLAYHEQPAAGNQQKRLLEHSRIRYRPNDLGAAAGSPNALLNPGHLESLALPGESYKLALTADHAALILADRVNDAVFAEGGYVHTPDAVGQLDGHWWIPTGRIFYSTDTNDDAAAETLQARQHFYLPVRFHDPLGGVATVRYDEHDLLIEQSTDPAQNRIQVRNNYRLLQPEMLTDPNDNRSQVAYDVLGLVAGTAVMGKADEDQGDSLVDFQPQLTQNQIDAFFANPQGLLASQLLGNATSRIIYDESRFARLGEANPPFAATISRETHLSHLADGEATKIQVSLVYSDGFGREIQRKIQAEPGPILAGGPTVSPRWVGSGWTIFNNKGQPIKQYEPFFDDDHQFRFGRAVGVSPTLFYDPVGRVVATLHPNHAWEKVIFDPWRQESWDVNDTVLRDSATDADVGDFFRRLPDDDYQPTWHQTRTNPALAQGKWPGNDPTTVQRRAFEADAAAKAEIHRDTPTVTYLDSLGRSVLTLAHNKFRQNGAMVEAHYTTRTDLDLEGKPLAIIDDRGRRVMGYELQDGVQSVTGYDIAGNLLYQHSMDAGARRLLINVAGNIIRSWDSRGHTVRTVYDALQRPIEIWVDDGDAERLAERLVYGEAQGTANNHRTRLYQHFDGAGLMTYEAYDFKGNPVHSQRRLLVDYQQAVNWDDNPAQEGGLPYTTQAAFDALNRAVSQTLPDGTIIRPQFNEANLLNRVTVQVRGAAMATTFVNDIDYDAKGQRQRISYSTIDGLNVTTSYHYEDETFRLLHLKTERGSDSTILQDLHYAFDPAGNITRIADQAQQTTFFRNQRVDPATDYIYDAIYRLIQATGREHLGQQGGNPLPPVPTSATDAPRVGLPHPGDRNAMGLYTEQYAYDSVGNILRMRHRGSDPAQPGWTRCYQYAVENNRLLSTGNPNTPNDPDSDCPDHYAVNPIHAERYTYDAHGNMTAMPHLAAMAWDYRDQLQQVDLGGGGTAWYVYDSAGQRVRKVIERQNGTRREERIYLGGFELYREYSGNGETVALARETVHIIDDTRRIALVETKTIADQNPVLNPLPIIRYQFDNHLGSASLELTETGQLISYEEYYSYGGTAYQATDGAIEVSLKRYRYTGKERDEETGLYYHGARYYAPWLGRWVSVDPAGLEAGLNLFEYSHNNPVKFLDDNGKDPTPDQSRFRQIFNDRQRVDASRAHAQTLVQAFRDSQISGSSPRERFLSIISLTGGNPNGPTATFDTYTIRQIGTESDSSGRGVGDTGFRRELRDSIQYHRDAEGHDVPLHRLSSDQIGHFLTASSFGYSLTERDNYITRQHQEAARYREQHPYLSIVRDLMDPTVDMQTQYAFEGEQYRRAMIGHEQIADRAFSGWGVTSTIAAPFLASPEDVQNFLNGRLDLIRIDDTQRGNSYQDILLTWIGYRFGTHIANDRFSSPNEAARWLEMMLTDFDLATVQSSDPFYQDAQQMQRMLQQFRDVQNRIHPQTTRP